MPSLADIPDTLLQPDRQLDFLNWLTTLHIDLGTAREFMHIWRAYTHRNWQEEHYQFIERQLRG